MTLLDLLFPKHCLGCKRLGAYLCPACFSTLSFSDTSLCFICNRSFLNGLTHPICKKSWTINGIYAGLIYAGLFKQLIYQFKYQFHLTDLQEILGELFYEGIIQHERVMKELPHQPQFIPIPLFKTKERKRGYNQAYKLALSLAQKIRFRSKNCLVRKTQTTSQFSLDRAARKTNMQDAFSLLEKERPSIHGKTIFLIDDVVTSGSTLIEAAKVLKRSGVERVYGLTLAHGE